MGSTTQGPFDPTSTAPVDTQLGNSTSGCILIHNLSPYELYVTTPDKLMTSFVAAWSWRRYDVRDPMPKISWSVAATPAQSNPPLSVVFMETFELRSEAPPQYFGQYQRQTSIGNNVSTTASTAIKQDGNGPATSLIESTPSDQTASSFNLDNDGSGVWQVLSANVLRKIVNAVRGNSGVGKAIVDLGDAGDLTITTYHGVFDVGVTFPPGQIGAGAISSLATILGSQVSSAVAHASQADSTVAANAKIYADDGTDFVIVHRGTAAGVNYIGLLPATVEASIGGILFYVDSGGAQRAGLILAADGSVQAGANASGLAWSAAGALTKIGGQAAVGFGAPVIVADSGELNVTDTVAHNPLYSFTPPAQGVYRVSGYLVKHSGVASDVLFRVAYYDPHTAAFALNTFMAISGGGTTVQPLQGSSTGTVVDGAYGLYGPTFYAGTTQPINIAYQDLAGTPNDFLRVFIERLA